MRKKWRKFLRKRYSYLNWNFCINKTGRINLSMNKASENFFDTKFSMSRKALPVRDDSSRWGNNLISQTKLFRDINACTITSHLSHTTHPANGTEAKLWASFLALHLPEKKLRKFSANVDDRIARVAKATIFQGFLLCFCLYVNIFFYPIKFYIFFRQSKLHIYNHIKIYYL